MAGSVFHFSSPTNVTNKDDKSHNLSVAVAAWSPFCDNKRPVTFKLMTNDDKPTAQVLSISMKCPYCDHIYDDYAAYKDHKNDC